MYDFGFEGPIDRFGVGKTRKIWYTVLFLPPTLESQLPFDRYPRLRVDGEIADVPINGAWIPTGDGRRYMIVAPRTLKDAGVGVGDWVEMRFAIADQEAVDVPDELVRALSHNAVAKAAWDALTVGKRRGMTYAVHAAKTPATRARRIADVLDKLEKTVSAKMV